MIGHHRWNLRIEIFNHQKNTCDPFHPVVYLLHSLFCLYAVLSPEIFLIIGQQSDILICDSGGVDSIVKNYVKKGLFEEETAFGVILADKV